MTGMESPGRYTLDYLDEVQRARVAALYEARTVTLMKVALPRIKTAQSFDLIELARFITGDLDPATLPTAVLVACRCQEPTETGEDPDHG